MIDGHSIPDVVDESIESVELHLVDWCRKYPILGRYWNARAAAIIFVENPTLELSAIALRIAYSLWATAFDDVLDRENRSEQAVVRLVRECGQVVQEPSATAFRADELVVALNDLCLGLWSLANNPRFLPQWAAAFCKFLDGSLFEYQLATFLREGSVDRLPDLRSYLAAAEHSISLPWLLQSGIVLCEQPVSEEVLPGLVALSESCGRAVRLANDLATHAREESEQSANAVTLVTLRREGWEEGFAKGRSSSATETVATYLEKSLAHARDLGQRIRTGARVELGFLRATELAVYFYGVSDLRDVTARLR
jgi:hypothetical protein